MSFIKLDRDSFVNTKVKNNFSVKFEKNDLSSYISDNNFDTKNIIFSNEITYESIVPSLLSIEDSEEVKSAVSSFFNITFQNTSSFSDISNEKKYLKDQYDISNDNLKSSNFKNYFNIKREVQKNIINSISLSKLETINNTLYNYYDKDMTKDYYPEINFGYCNYNSLNLFSQKIQNNNTHTNCVVYSNQYDESSSKNEIDFSEDFSFNFWLNIRKNSSNVRGCLLHIPEVVSIYTLDTDSNYDLCITTGDSSKKLLNNINFPGINFNANQTQSTDGCYFIPESSLSYNNWYNINFSFLRNSSNSNDFFLVIHKDNMLIKSLEVNITSTVLNNFNSYICLGNKPEYFKTSSNSYNLSYEEIFYTFFGKKNTADHDGPFYQKDLNLGNKFIYNDSQINKKIDDIILEDKNITFNEANNESSAFCGEITDFKIYNKNLNLDDIEYLSKNNIENIEHHKTLGLQLYLPMFYLPAFVKKIGLFNNTINNANLYYSNIYNPYYANACGGLDISVENYLVDFVNFKKPNVVLNGANLNNIYGNITNAYEQSLSNDFQKIKKGDLVADIAVEAVENNIVNDTEIEIASGTNFYRNLLILPCDNGIPNIRFNTLLEALNENNMSQQNISANKIYNINCNSCLLGFEKIERKYKENLSNTAITYDIEENGESFEVNNNLDSYFNISNFLYHDESLTNQDNILNLSGSNNSLKSSIDFLVKSTQTNSNPVIRVYNDPVLKVDDVLLQEDITYKNLPLPYFDFNASKLNMFSVLYDISKSYYSMKIKKNSFSIEDNNIIGSNDNLKIKVSDNGNGILYRDDCLSKTAKWNYVGHLFYKEGIACINNPSLYYFGKRNFAVNMTGISNLYVHETNVIINQGLSNNSSNDSYNKDLRIDESSFNSDEPFVYISDVNLHDENFNIVAKARLAHPIPKKNTDNILIKLKMDY